MNYKKINYVLRLIMGFFIKIEVVAYKKGSPVKATYVEYSDKLTSCFPVI